MSNQEKAAWLTFSISMLIMCSSMLIFVFFRKQLVASQAILVAMSPISFFALTAFAPLVFLHTQKGSLTVTSQDGNAIHFPYRRYLIFGIIVGLLNGVLIISMILSKTGIVFSGLFTFLSIISIITISLLVIILAKLYVMKHRASAINMHNVSTTDMFFYGSDLDERDLAIRKTARWSIYSSFWALSISGIIGLWVWTQTQENTSVTIDSMTLPMFIFGALVLTQCINSLVTIALYRHGGK